jgi:carbon-monoxide dehydrogenase medium subunit
MPSDWHVLAGRIVVKPAKFSHYAPDSVSEVAALLSRFGDDARPLAGGQSLVPLMNMRIARPTVLVDLNRCRALDYVRVEKDHLAIGAMVRQAAAERTTAILDYTPLLAETLRFTGPRTVRNRATIGGSIAHADPVAELPGAAIALDASIIIESTNGARTIPAADFFVAQLTTAIEPGEFVREIRVPKAAAGARYAFIESGVRQEGVAIAGVAASLVMTNDRCASARIVAIGVSPVPARLTAVEAAIVGQSLTPERMAKAAADAPVNIDPIDDIHASAHYRRRLTVTLAERALAQALNRKAA